MNIYVATSVYKLKAGDVAHVIDPVKSKMLSERIAVLKDPAGQRIACIVESKKGYTVDLVKKMHLPKPTDEGWCVRDYKGRFVKRGA